MRKSVKTAVAILLLLAGVALLIFKTVSETGVYYLTVGEVIAGQQSERRGVRVSGEVVAGSIAYDQERLTLTLSVRDMDDPTLTMQVVYKGVRPDALKDEVEVILEGRYQRTNNTFYAETLLAKCPSKYEGATDQENK